MLDRVILTKFLTHRVSLESSHPNFQKIFVSPKLAAILKFRIFLQKLRNIKNAYISKTVLDRAISTKFSDQSDMFTNFKSQLKMDLRSLKIGLRSL